jgi:hypothetical protein
MLEMKAFLGGTSGNRMLCEIADKYGEPDVLKFSGKHFIGLQKSVYLYKSKFLKGSTA